MSEYTKTPWAAFKDPETGNWFVVNSPSGLVCDMDGSGLTEEANARHIVHCVNNHERLVDMLRELVETEDAGLFEVLGDDYCERLNELLAAMEAEKGGE